MVGKVIAMAERREYPRISFTATALVVQPNSADVVVGATTELSQFGCFVHTANPLPQRSRIHIEIDDGTYVFSGSGVLAYVRSEGMGIAFGIVEAKNCEVLARWLSRKTKIGDR